MKPIRIAVLGLEHYHANFWTKAFLQSPDAVVAGVWDGDASLARSFGDAHGVAVRSDADSLISDADAVAICSATADHPALVEAAARLGRPVLCEKPLGATKADCLRIAETVRRTGIRFMQSFPKRFDPINRELLDLLGSGDLGRVTLCRIRHGHSHGLGPDFHKAWFVDPARSGGGTLLDEGVHAADLLRMLFGDPESVQAVTSSAALDRPVEDTAAAIFRYAGGLIAEVSTSWCFAAADASVEIYGTRGTALLSGVDIASRPTRDRDFLRIFRRGADGSGSWSSSATVPNFRTGVFHQHVAWAYVEALKTGAPMPVGVDDGLRAFAMIDAAYRSAASGRSEPIDFAGQV